MTNSFIFLLFIIGIFVYTLNIVLSNFDITKESFRRKSPYYSMKDSSTKNNWIDKFTKKLNKKIRMISSKINKIDKKIDKINDGLNMDE